MCGPTSKGEKNDDRDAEAIAEAATRPTMRLVALKSDVQLNMQTLHRVRDQLVGERTALMNQIRAILLERGHIAPQGLAKLTVCLIYLLDADSDLDITPRMRFLVADVQDRWQPLDAHRSPRHGVHLTGPGRRKSAPAHDHPGHRRFQHDGAGRGDR